MRRVQLHAREARVNQYFCTAREAGDNVLDVVFRHRLGLTKLPTGQPKLDG